MRFETIDAFDYLVSTYVSAIEATGTKIPEDTVELIGTDPFKACEALNDFALSCNAITPELDAVLQNIYEAMDADDARSDATPEACQRCLATFARVHVEIPDPEPEPEPEESPEATEAAEDEAGAAEEPKGRKRRNRRNRKQDAEQAEDTSEANTNTEASADQADTDNDSKKPAKRTRTRKDKKAEAAEAGESTEANADTEARKSTKPKRTRKAPKKATDKEEKSSEKAAPAAATFEGDALTVDQALAILGCSRPKLTKMIEAGELPAYKKGRSWQVSAAAVLDKAAGL